MANGDKVGQRWSVGILFHITLNNLGEWLLNFSFLSITENEKKISTTPKWQNETLKFLFQKFYIDLEVLQPDSDPPGFMWLSKWKV